MILVLFFIVGAALCIGPWLLPAGTLSPTQQFTLLAIGTAIVILIAIMSVTNDPHGKVASIMTMVPFWSPMLMPLRYLLSGGVSMRSLMPGWSFGPWKAFERLLSPWMSYLAMFAFIQVDRQ